MFYGRYTAVKIVILCCRVEENNLRYFSAAWAMWIGGWAASVHAKTATEWGAMIVWVKKGQNLLVLVIHRLFCCLLPCQPPTPVLSSSFWFMDSGGLDRGPCLLPIIHTLGHIHWMCCNSVTLFIRSHDIYCSVHPGERSSSVALLKGSSLFSPEKVFLFLGSWSWSDVKGQRSGRSCVDRL